MKGARFLLCGLQKKNDKKKKPGLSKQLGTYSYVLTGYSLETACARGDLNTVLEILDSMPYSSSKPKLAVALNKAALQGHPEIVKALLDAGADPNEPNERGLSPLMQASRLGHIGVVKALLASKDILLDFEQQLMGEERSITALHYACRSGREDVISALLAAGANPNAQFPGEESLLSLCAQHPKDLFPVIKTLVQMGADVNYCSDRGMPALHRVALRRCPETTLFLLENGANLQHWVSFTGPVLQRIAADKLSKSQCFCNTQKTIKALLDYDTVDLNCPVSGTTPLLCAVRRGNVDFIRTMLKFNADPDVRNKLGQTAVQLALSNDIPYKTKIVQMLMRAECSLNGTPTTATTYDVFTNDDEIYHEVKVAKSNPRLLMRQCRRFLRRHLGSHLDQKVASLDLTDKLKNFLLLDDVPDVVCICGSQEKKEVAFSLMNSGSESDTETEVEVIVVEEDTSQNHTQTPESNASENPRIVPAKKSYTSAENLSAKQNNFISHGLNKVPGNKMASTKVLPDHKNFKVMDKETSGVHQSLESVRMRKNNTWANLESHVNGGVLHNGQMNGGVHHNGSYEGKTSNGKRHKHDNEGMTFEMAHHSHMAGGLLLNGQGFPYVNREVAAAGMRRVASAGMMDSLQKKPSKTTRICKSASHSFRSVNFVQQTQDKKIAASKAKTASKQKHSKKQDYIVVKFF